MKSKVKETPLMSQYNRIKAKYPDNILLFRVGDFYETFGNDAIIASKILDIVLTKRANGSSNIELAGFPFHSLQTYLPKLVRSGNKVAICEQLEDPKMTKKIVKRGVTEIITPGVTFNDNTLEIKKNNFLASVYVDKLFGISFLDVTTGDFFTYEGDEISIIRLINSFNPKEILISKTQINELKNKFTSFYKTEIDDWIFDNDFNINILNEHFNTKSLKGFGINGMKNSIVTAGVCLHYIKENSNNNISHINSISRIDNKSNVWIDQFTIKNLEIINKNSEDLSLIDIIDSTNTPMASRLIKRWVLFPLTCKKDIIERHKKVQLLKDDQVLRLFIDEKLKFISDIERICSKIATAKISPKSCIDLMNSSIFINEIKVYLNNSLDFKKISAKINPLENLINIINHTIVDNPPALVNKGNFIKNGVNVELDELRKVKRNTEIYLDNLLKEEIEKTEISSLKIGFNNIFGYYFEVRNTHKEKVPDNWTRKQTLVSAERYINEELKELEIKILSSNSRIQEIELSEYEMLIEKLNEFINDIKSNSNIISTIDCLLSFSKVSIDNNYVRPKIIDKVSIEIKNGRHPIIEKSLPIGEKYIPNNIILNKDYQQVLMITGPNMSGKSAVLRQTALIVILAQIGCFVPAEKAEIGIFDKIFTRVGASDNISSGESTFMVEMNETASIVNNLSKRSLIILDEIGRGTSTYDGISIAWAIAKYIHDIDYKPLTLFATHYHELNEMEKKYSRIKNFHVSIKNIGDKILFLRKLIKGGTSHSFGIHVGKMAGLPAQIINTSEKILKDLEQKKPSNKVNEIDELQLTIFDNSSSEMKEIKKILDNVDIENMTPVDSLIQLSKLKQILKNK
ncbi:MAG: DNA mismatch repair protein MutS [Flavobacteriales bacterium TMED84]|nr:MAG: DNA mismatch repair protein MutS [Flavobacteriales bacterium TMED84]|tara:strand:+ start:10569 stop:13136 length:2568 start_codon:yes stop_codon:yes gene_type:complete